MQILDKSLRFQECKKAHECILKSEFTNYEMFGMWSPPTTVCPGSSDPFYISTYYIKWVTSGTQSFVIIFSPFKGQWKIGIIIVIVVV